MTQPMRNPNENQGNLLYNSFILSSTVFPYLYKKYKNRITNKVFNKKETNPWMRYKEIKILKEIYSNLQPKHCLEWGAGYSTLYFPNFLDENMKWISIEHDRKWAMKIKKLNQRSNVHIHHQKPNHFPWTDEFEDGAYSDLKNYIEYPSKFGKFDCILIDGRARNECLVKAFDIVESNGLVILHDANRIYYHEQFKLYKYQVLFEDNRDDAGGLWVGSKNLQIETILDVKRYKILWYLIEKYSNKTLGRGWARDI